MWKVDGRKLQGKDKHIVLPVFAMTLGDQDAMFRLIISSRCEVKGCTSFVKSGGRGSVQLKCQTILPNNFANVSYRIWLGNKHTWLEPRDPFSHNFAESAISDLPAGSDLWDFNAAVDQETSVFAICLEEMGPGSRHNDPTTAEKADQNGSPFAKRFPSPPTSCEVPLARRLFDDSSFSMLSKLMDDDSDLSSSSDDDTDSE
jgi:hypothetical protein